MNTVTNETRDWPEAMKQVASFFTGEEGVFLQLGDSITLARPNVHWALAGKGRNRQERSFLNWAHAGAQNERDGWHLATAVAESNDWSITTFTATVAATSKYVLTGQRGLPPLTELIRKYNPQMVLYGVGLSDVFRSVPVSEYIRNVREAIELLRANGTVPILSTLTPSATHNEEVLKVNRALREFARIENLPLLDIYAEMESRNHNIFEFLDKDGRHLTSSLTDGPATEENLSTSGYLLRCYLVVQKGMEVKQKVLDLRHPPGLKERALRLIRRWGRQGFTPTRIPAYFGRVR